jgi:hypothetical protein
MVYLYALFIAGYFLLPMATGHRKVYYYLVLPATLLLWREVREFYRGNALAALLLAYTGYMLVTLAWSQDYSGDAALEISWYTFNLMSFVFISGFLWIQYPRRMDRLAFWCIWLAAATALVSCIAWYLNNPFPASRLEPLGVMHHQNKAACAYGLFTLLAAWHFTARPEERGKWLLLIPAALLACLVILTQSRTALAALSVGLLTLVGYRALGAIAIGSLASWGLLTINPQDWWHRVSEFSFRPTIWLEVLKGMDNYWVFGHGYLFDPQVWTVDKTFNHAHNSYLATLRDGGLVGLLLLSVTLGVALLWAVRLRQQRGERLYLALLLYGMTCVTMDFDRLFTHPKEIWMFFWLPVALIMAVYPNRRDPGLLRYPSTV